MKQDVLERSQTDLKKLRRKSQAKHSSKYDIKENEVRFESKPAAVPFLTSENVLDGFPKHDAVKCICSYAWEEYIASDGVKIGEL